MILALTSPAFRRALASGALDDRGDRRRAEMLAERGIVERLMPRLSTGEFSVHGLVHRASEIRLRVAVVHMRDVECFERRLDECDCR